MRKHKWKDCSPGWTKQKVRPYLKINQSQKEEEYGSRGRLPDWQVQGFEFNPQYCQNKKNK
jgi:hypothetical protein